ncbi:hypothetical protein BDD12DRAFT_946536 [Trichophaea hybrida]|nr:hypothetical protein BDD12DRAFT_946536 [Trichophaea hybrida]
MNNMNFSSFNNGFQRVIGYLWDPEPKNTDFMNSIWLLGQEYPSVALPPPPKPQSSPDATHTPDDELSEAQSTWPREFLEDFESRVWMTYRNEFSPIPRSYQGTAGMSIMTAVRSQLPVHSQGFTSDQGWGCMIRSGQCVLANALFVLNFGRAWRKGQRIDEEKHLLSLFADDPAAPFSIHKFVHQGELRDIRSGQWFGPTPTAQCIKALTESYPPANLRVYMTFDGNVYEDTFHKTALSPDGVFNPTLLLVVTRLGLDSTNPLYYEALKATVQMPQSIGIAGGRPSSSHYFIGVQGDYLFYLDPHVVRPALRRRTSPEEYTAEEVGTCHTMRLRRLHVRDVDPSMMFAFLIRDENEWQAWRRGVKEVQGRAVVTVADCEPMNDSSGVVREEAIAEVISESEGEEEEGELVG